MKHRFIKANKCNSVFIFQESEFVLGVNCTTWQFSEFCICIVTFVIHPRRSVEMLCKVFAGSIS